MKIFILGLFLMALAGGTLAVNHFQKPPVLTPVTVSSTTPEVVKDIEKPVSQEKTPQAKPTKTEAIPTTPVIHTIQNAVQAPPPVPGNYYPQVSSKLQGLLSLDTSFNIWLESKDTQLDTIISNLQYSSDPLAGLKIQKANALKKIISGLEDRTDKDIAKWQQISSLLEQTKIRVPGGYATEEIYEQVPSPDFLADDIAAVKADINREISSI